MKCDKYIWIVTIAALFRGVSGEVDLGYDVPGSEETRVGMNTETLTKTATEIGVSVEETPTRLHNVVYSDSSSSIEPDEKLTMQIHVPDESRDEPRKTILDESSDPGRSTTIMTSFNKSLESDESEPSYISTGSVVETNHILLEETHATGRSSNKESTDHSIVTSEWTVKSSEEVLAQETRTFDTLPLDANVPVQSLSDDLYIDPSHSDPSHSNPSQSDPSHSDLSHSDPPHPDPSNADPSNLGPVNSSPDSVDSLLSEPNDDPDDPKFLSFEEWRKLNLDKSGQIAENLDNRPPHPQHNSISPNVEPIGDDMEIDMTMFSGEKQPKADNIDASEDLLGQEGKVYKSRFNYASLDCAATIVKTNSDTKGASNILFENKDTYMLNKCSAPNKFVIIELCEDILVDTVAIANFEFFSSMFRKIRISVSDRFPVPEHGWKVLGEYEAQSLRDIQTFSIKNPLIWARFLRIEFLTHWGHEFYCPVSLVRVHGTTMIEEYKHQEQHIELGKEQEKTAQKNDRGDINNPQSDNNHSSETVAHVSAENGISSSSDCTTVNSSSSVDNSACSNKSTDNINQAINSLVMTEPVMNLISPLVLNESCKWSDYLEDSGIVSGISLNKSNPDTSDIPSTPSSEPEPKTQASIYKTIMNRLSLLESNATLSLKYIEQQGQNLREMLMKIEKKQNVKIELFLNQLNNTIYNQLQFYRVQYGNLIKSTSAELDLQREKSEHDALALSGRLTMVTEELMFQKKLAITQAIMLLTLLIFVIMTRGTLIEGPSEYNGFQHRSKRARFGKDSWRFQLSSPGSSASPNSNNRSPSMSGKDEPHMLSPTLETPRSDYTGEDEQTQTEELLQDDREDPRNESGYLTPHSEAEE